MKVETITPEIAKVYLEHNTNNRKENKGHVAFLAKQMSAGEWQMNGEAIVFDKDGNLSNGQHRLKACILANVPFTTAVVRGVEPKAFSTFDSGYKRSSSQVFQIADIPNGVVVSAIIGAFWKMTTTSKGNFLRINNSDGSTRDHYRSKKASNTKLLEIYNQDPEFWQSIGRNTRKCYARCRLLNCTQIGSIAAYLIKEKLHEPDFVWAFIEQIFFDEFTTLECIKLLRRKLIDDAMAGAKVRMSLQYKEQLIITCWNLYKNGTDSKVLRWSPNINEVLRWE